MIATVKRSGVNDKRWNVTAIGRFATYTAANPITAANSTPLEPSRTRNQSRLLVNVSDAIRIRPATANTEV